MKGKKTVWTPEMLQILKTEFPNTITIDLCEKLGVSVRTIIRKARELDIDKIDGFLDVHRKEITRRAQESHPGNPHKGDKTFRIPGGEKYQFKKGGPRPAVDYQKIRAKRNETIRKEKMRVKYGLPQKTKLKLVNVY